ncbi:uncharacterized protein EI97DRAFT_432383 [Westerdykella ornata]|uniref:NTF2-like protein n=1 Tax=Westerdykella ornata TaxID=318751 RepID=A0A6A6JRF8_WESOR|nr:uncharacterized protein EI97DRAFT_432383 [Westerdykella ornata]KAF2277519.1 hypothetical protein EI97DRAFT_432383 [Westerdykella ornata]
MTLSAIYQAFLARPSSEALVDDASLHYITTLTSINTAAAIVKHYTVQEKLLKKRGDKVLNSIEDASALSLEVETTIEFVAGGGAYLPGLDDNFVADRTVTFPMIHFVKFDKDQKITQIRLHWDQGSLLKQIDVIGARARNWPIRDGKEQAHLIATSAGSAATSGASAGSCRRSTASRGPDDVTITGRPASRSTTSNAMNDPHASLNLFQPRDIENETSNFSQPSAQRAQSAKPRSRNLSELIAGEDPASPSPAEGPVPNTERIPTKAGGGKNYKPNRLFDEEAEPVATPLSVKTNAKKYSHFEFGEGEDARPVETPLSVKTNAKKYNHFEFGHGDEDEPTPRGREPPRPTRTKHMSQWDFEDFVTPEKTKPKVLREAVRHFGWSDDEEEASPVRRPVVHKPRPDANPHFEFKDEDTPEARREAAPSRGRLHNKGLGLYKDHVLHSTSDDEGDDAHQGDVKRPLGDVTTVVKNENRQKDFGSHWEMTDHSPALPKDSSNGNGTAKPIPADRKKVLSSLDSHWGLYDESPEQHQRQKENAPKERGINISGNGMGGRKGTTSNWTLGDDGVDEQQQAAQKKTHTRAAESKSFWDF